LNDWEDLANITVKTAGVFLETVQGDAGVRIPDVAFLQALRERCTATGTLLVFDEIQCGLGRTGRHFAFEHFGVIPDVLVLGKALGGGMPIGALVTSQELMSVFKDHPKLGHITTFGGHPVACAAAAGFLQVLKSEINFDQVEASASIFRSIIGNHPEILEVRNLGLMFAFDMASAERVERVVMRCLEKRILTFWFLSHPYSFRLAPPLTITPEEARYYAQEIYQAIEETKA
jgi:acetylornithine/succinyldiaminopimelate/putrescine aminotransferase